MFDFTNFHDDTTANFTPCELPAREADFTSPSGSRYWDEGDAVVRASDHWGCGIRSCSWFLSARSHAGFAVGRCAYSAFANRFSVAAHKMHDRAWFNDNGALPLPVLNSQFSLAPGMKVAAVRKWTERRRGGYFSSFEAEIEFVVKKITACFIVADDGARYAKHTLSKMIPLA